MWPFNRHLYKPVPCTCRFTALGTVIQQDVYGIHAPDATRRVAREIQRLDELWSPYRSHNIVARITKCAGVKPVKADRDTLRILSKAVEMAASSRGKYDITAQPLIRLWRNAARLKHLPSEDQISRARNLIGIDDIHFPAPGEIFLARKGGGVDLGGIGKGYAADRANQIYRQAGIRHALINLGGNVAALNGKPDASPWTIGVKNPHNPNGEPLGFIRVNNQSVVTSGGYERYFECTDAQNRIRRYHHILDPKTGWPADSGVAAVTVVAASSTRCDALATAAFILGIKEGMALCASFDDTHVLFVDTDGDIHVSPGMADIFTVLHNSKDGFRSKPAVCQASFANQ